MLHYLVEVSTRDGLGCGFSMAETITSYRDAFMACASSELTHAQLIELWRTGYVETGGDDPWEEADYYAMLACDCDKPESHYESLDRLLEEGPPLNFDPPPEPAGL